MLVFKPCTLPCYKMGQALESGNYKIVHYDYLQSGAFLIERSNWIAYHKSMRVNTAPYSTQLEAENACILDYNNMLKMGKSNFV